MRTGEVFALTWDDVDFEKRTIRVNKTNITAILITIEPAPFCFPQAPPLF